MHTFAIAAAASLAFIAVPALAAEEEQAPAVAEAPAKPEPKICKKQKLTGSLTKVSKICMTRTEWDKVRAQTKQAIDDYGRNNTLAAQAKNPMGGS